CLGLELLGVERVHLSAVNVGSGTVQCDHGLMPVPAPATARLLAGQPTYSAGPEMELTTPTGAAIAAALGESFGRMPAMRVDRIGFGAGSKDFKGHANVLRVMIGESSRAIESTTVSVIEANIDDATPQVLGYAMDRLFEEGALDVTLQPLLMKKNRQGSLLRIVARPEDQEKLARVALAETTTLGVRVYSAERRVQEREMVTVETEYGAVRMKVTPDGFAPEYDDCQALARAKSVPLKQVIAAANLEYLRNQ
ncbi:MAG: LarC family nickel insertion protein, partial [Bryobacteraceae bacterium]|nr:LarC family nickel insertion protein [Bryobacteraceae bacterium]